MCFDAPCSRPLNMVIILPSSWRSPTWFPDLMQQNKRLQKEWQQCSHNKHYKLKNPLLFRLDSSPFSLNKSLLKSRSSVLSWTQSDPLYVWICLGSRSTTLAAPVQWKDKRERESSSQRWTSRNDYLKKSALMRSFQSSMAEQTLPRNPDKVIFKLTLIY